MEDKTGSPELPFLKRGLNTLASGSPLQITCLFTTGTQRPKAVTFSFVLMQTTSWEECKLTVPGYTTHQED